jgi:hypothetical protein
MTVGFDADRRVAEEIAVTIGREFRAVGGAISDIELVDLGGEPVQSIQSFELGRETISAPR